MLETRPLRPVGTYARAGADAGADAQGAGADPPSDPEPEPESRSVVSGDVLRLQEGLIRALLRREPAANHTFQLRWPSAAAAATAAAVGPAAAAAAATATAAQDESGPEVSALPAGLLQLMRIHALDEGFVAQAGGGGDGVLSRLKQGAGGALFPSHELEAVAMLRERLRSLLDAYGSSLEEDEAALAALPPPSLAPDAHAAAAVTDEQQQQQHTESDITRWCLHVRIGEKRLLQYHYALLASYQDSLRRGLAAEHREKARQRRKDEGRRQQELADEELKGEESLHLEL